MTHLGIQLLSLMAFGGLALAMDRPQETVFGHRLPRRTSSVLRLVGWAMLALTLLAAIAHQDLGLGLVSFTGHISLSAGLVFAALIIWERRRAAH